MPLQPGWDGRTGRYAARNHSDYTPAAVLVFDAEAWREQRPDGELQRLRLWCARWVRRREQKHYQPADERHWGTDASQLAALIDGKTRGDQHLWCYAHNLKYDIWCSGLLPQLAALGWQVSAVSSLPDYFWVTLARHTDRCPRSPAAQARGGPGSGKCKCPVVTMADSAHMWPVTVGELGDLLGMPKLPMPAQDADESEWVRYCMRDVDIPVDALLTMMAFWDEHKLGRWAITNASTMFRTLRHTLPGRPWVVFADQESSMFDRSAIYGGRRTCWRHGDLPPGRYVEIDIEQAYATVGANWPLPFKRGAWFDGLDTDDHRVDHPAISCIAECEVETDVPRFPVRVDGGVDYPVGRFVTVLAGPEIAWARELGCLRRIGRGQWHLLGTGYQPFFRRVLEWGRPGVSDIPPVVARAWKQAGRTVPGKFAQRGYHVDQTTQLSSEVLAYEQVFNAATLSKETLIHYGGYVHRAYEQGEGTYAYPAVTAFIESRTRVAAGRLAEMIGDRAMVLCGTDGVWCSASAIDAGDTGSSVGWLAGTTGLSRSALLIALAEEKLAPFRPREKHVSHRFRLAGPQIYEADTVSKASGRPRGLERQGDGTWAGDMFPGLQWQQQHSEPGVYRVMTASWQWPAVRIRGWCLAGGLVRACEMAIAPGGGNMVLPWRATRWAAAGDRLAPVQHPALEGLYDPVEHTSQEVAGDSSIWERAAEDARQARDDRRRAAGIARPQDGVRAVLAEEGAAGGLVPGWVGPGP